MFQPARRPSLILAPALLTTIAYVDPGNFGTNIASGSHFGFALGWVVLAASAAAALVQYLAGKLGLATGQGLAWHIANRLPTGPRIAAWLQAEVVVIMTDLTEIVGGALGLYLLFGMPLPVGALVIGAFSFLVLAIRAMAGEFFRPVALSLLAVVAVSVLWAVTTLHPELSAVMGGLRPRPLQGEALLLAVGIIGATVMPHALYFHSALGRSSVHEPSASRVALVCRQLRRSIIVAMGLAAVVNLAILVLGASVGDRSADSINTASRALHESGRGFAATLLGIALVASGLASSVIGAWTGQAVMAGFLKRSISVWVRRLVALGPPVLLLALGVDPDWALVASQIVLSFALPFTLIVLVLLTSRRDVMGRYRNGRLLTAAAWVVTGLITVLDALVLLGW